MQAGSLRGRSSSVHYTKKDKRSGGGEVAELRIACAEIKDSQPYRCWNKVCTK